MRAAALAALAALAWLAAGCYDFDRFRRQVGDGGAGDGGSSSVCGSPTRLAGNLLSATNARFESGIGAWQPENSPELSGVEPGCFGPRALRICAPTGTSPDSLRFRFDLAVSPAPYAAAAWVALADPTRDKVELFLTAYEAPPNFALTEASTSLPSTAEGGWQRVHTSVSATASSSIVRIEVALRDRRGTLLDGTGRCFDLDQVWFGTPPAP